VLNNEASITTVKSILVQDPNVSLLFFCVTPRLAGKILGYARMNELELNNEALIATVKIFIVQDPNINVLYFYDTG
jgi:hypothetical protein